MACEQAASLGLSMDDLKEPGRHSRGEIYLLQLHRGERRELRGLEDHGITARQRRSRLPAGDLQRIVPCADAGNDAEGLATRVAECRGTEIEMLTGDAAGEAGVVLETFGSRNHVHGARLLDGLAGVTRLEDRELLVALAQEPGGTQQHASALGTAQFSPLLLRRLCARYRGIDLRGAGTGELGEQLSIGGIDDAQLLRGPNGSANRRPKRRANFRSHACELPQAAIDKRRQQGACAAAVSLGPCRKCGSQPHAVDHGGNHRRKTASLLDRYHPPQVVAQIREHAALISTLYALQTLDMRHLSPEGQPSGGRAPVELLGTKVAVDDGLHPEIGRACQREPRAHPRCQRSRERAKGGLEQAVLVIEVVRYESGGDARAAGDLRKSGADVADFGETVDRDVDELYTPGLLSVISRRGPVGPGGAL